jgi:hypothetical protein
MRRTLNLIIKAIVVFVPILIVIVLIPIIVSLVIMIHVYEKGPPVPTDAEMIEHFKSHEKLFEELCLMIKNDYSLSSFPLSIHEKEMGKLLSVSVDREFEYNSLMEKIQIIRFWNKNLVYFEKGDATWGIEKGFEYVLDRTEEENKEFTEEELYDLAIEKLGNCNLYKKINDNWNLYIMYDR